MPFNNLHREDGPAIEYSNGTKAWYVNGVRHRINGPAVTKHNGIKEWYQYGKRHRLDGPAVIFKSGHKKWYINGKEIDTKKVETWIKLNHINLKTKQHQALFMLRFG